MFVREPNRRNGGQRPVLHHTCSTVGRRNPHCFNHAGRRRASTAWSSRVQQAQSVCCQVADR